MPEQQGVMSTYQLMAHNHSGIGQGGLVDPTVINHDALLNFVGAEHLSLPNTIVNVLTDHNKVAHDALNIDADQVDGIDIPNTIANVLTNHTKAVHDALAISELANEVHIDDLVLSGGNLFLNVNNSNSLISGGSSTSAGANIVLYGGTHATLPDIIRFRIDANEQMRLDANGYLILYSATSKITGGTCMYLEAGASGIRSLTIYNDTTSDGANMNIGVAAKQIKRSTSGKKYKEKITNLELDSSLIYNLRPVSFNSKCEGDDKKKRYVGLIADEIEQIYPDIINYSKNNEAESYDNQMLMTLILKEVQELNGRMSALEN